MSSTSCLVLVFAVFVSLTSGSLYEVFDPCCSEGVKWSTISFRCDNYPAPVLNISDTDQAACMSIIEVCCIKQIQLTTCEDGKLTAIQGDICAIRDSDPGAEQFRECCQCCRLGIEAKRSTPACKSPGLGVPCDEKYMECCLSSVDSGVELNNTRGVTTPMTNAPPITLPTTITLPIPQPTQGNTGFCRDGHECKHICRDMSFNGDKTCFCYGGFRLQSDGKSCQDIDECTEGTSRCLPDQECVNSEGRYTCKNCPRSSTYNPVTKKCETDIDCMIGFQMNPLTKRCEDINECGLGIDTCKVGERCENTAGGYTCRRIHHCGTGYTLDEASQSCMDNNECILGTHDCRGGYRCQNIKGSYRCVPKTCNSTSRFDHIKGECVEVACSKGYKSNNLRRCVDINECVERSRSACRRFQRCINTPGSYYCRNIVNCPPGYEATEKDKCEDVDECKRGTHKCGPEQQCINRQGTYFCQCPRGLRHDNLGRCIDVDECSYGASICPSNSKCTNTLGSYKCECVDGLQNGGGDSCTDIDECAQAGVCQQSCVNVLGTFFCTCDTGYQLRDDKRSCEDIDECTQFGGRGGRSGVCGGTCINMPGSYKCDCPSGWKLKNDKKSCEDVNECKTGTAYCPQRDSVCINTRGGYKCPVVNCPEGFLKLNTSSQQNSVRCKRISTTCPECRRKLKSRSFNFLSFASNVLVPAPLFSMTGSHLVGKYYTWDLKLVSARPMGPGVKPATIGHFALEKSRDFSRVTLLKRVDGPQDVLLQLGMNITTIGKGFDGKVQSYIYLYITEEDQH